LSCHKAVFAVGGFPPADNEEFEAPASGGRRLPVAVALQLKPHAFARGDKLTLLIVGAMDECDGAPQLVPEDLTDAQFIEIGSQRLIPQE
jgi:hypothetical protein